MKAPTLAQNAMRKRDRAANLEHVNADLLAALEGLTEAVIRSLERLQNGELIGAIQVADELRAAQAAIARAQKLS